MQALRIVKKPDNGIVSVQLPESFEKDRDVEIIILPIDKQESNKKIDTKKFRGILKGKDIDVKKECEEMRKEWDRGI